MEKILSQLVEEKATGSYIVKRDGTNSDRCIVESSAFSSGCILTEWKEYDHGDIVMDFEYNMCSKCDGMKGHFIVVACEGNFTDWSPYA
jgi:hypothetical protein